MLSLNLQSPPSPTFWRRYLGMGTGHDLMREITQMQINAALRQSIDAVAIDRRQLPLAATISEVC